MKVLGIGNAIVDVICKVEDKYLLENKLTKSTMKLVDETEFKKLLSTLKIEDTVSGGSVANSIVGLSQLGNKVGFIGKVNDDALGKKYEDFAGLIDDLQEPYTLNSKGKRLIPSSHEKAAAEPEKYWGQSLEDYDPDHPDGLYQRTQGLNYNQFIAPMIKAIQELDAENTKLKARVADLE